MKMYWIPGFHHGYGPFLYLMVFEIPDNEEINYYYPTNDLVTAPEILFFLGSPNDNGRL